MKYVNSYCKALRVNVHLCETNTTNKMFSQLDIKGSNSAFDHISKTSHMLKSLTSQGQESVYIFSERVDRVLSGN